MDHLWRIHPQIDLDAIEIFLIEKGIIPIFYLSLQRSLPYSPFLTPATSKKN